MRSLLLCNKKANKAGIRIADNHIECLLLLLSLFFLTCYWIFNCGPLIGYFKYAKSAKHHYCAIQKIECEQTKQYGHMVYINFILAA
jgi:hypothetical protein